MELVLKCFSLSKYKFSILLNDYTCFHPITIWWLLPIEKINKFWECSLIFIKHMPSWCPFLYLHLITHPLNSRCCLTINSLESIVVPLDHFKLNLRNPNSIVPKNKFLTQSSWFQDHINTLAIFISLHDLLINDLNSFKLQEMVKNTPNKIMVQSSKYILRIEMHFKVRDKAHKKLTNFYQDDLLYILYIIIYIKSKWSWSLRSSIDIFKGLHYPLTRSNMFSGGRGKRGALVGKDKGPWQGYVVIINV